MTANPRVLVIEDDPAVAGLLARLIQSQPYECVVTCSAEDALGALEEQPIDVVVCDEVMPDVRGTDLLAFARQRWPHLRSILLTGHVSVDVALRAVNNAQVSRLLTKPCSADTLLEALEGVVTGGPDPRHSSWTPPPRRVRTAPKLGDEDEFASLQSHLQSLAG